MVKAMKVKNCGECGTRFSYEVKPGAPPKKCDTCKIPIAQRVYRFCVECTTPFKHTGDGRPYTRCPNCRKS